MDIFPNLTMLLERHSSVAKTVEWNSVAFSDESRFCLQIIGMLVSVQATRPLCGFFYYRVAHNLCGIIIWTHISVL